MKRNKLGTTRIDAVDENGKAITVDFRRTRDGGLILDLSNDPGGPMVLSPDAARKFLAHVEAIASKRKGSV